MNAQPLRQTVQGGPRRGTSGGRRPGCIDVLQCNDGGGGWRLHAVGGRAALRNASIDCRSAPADVCDGIDGEAAV